MQNGILLWQSLPGCKGAGADWLGDVGLTGGADAAAAEEAAALLWPAGLEAVGEDLCGLPLFCISLEAAPG